MDLRRTNAARYCRKCGYDLTGNVSGRCPECGLDRLGSILILLARREKVSHLKAVGSVVLGVMLLPIGPFVIATAFWLVSLRLGRHAGFPEGLPWWGLFLGFFLLMVPLLFRLELRTKGRYADNRIDEFVGIGPTGVAATPGLLLLPLAAASVAANSRTLASAFTEFFLLGPRAILFGMQHRRIARRFHTTSRERAGNVLLRLVCGTEGMETSRLLNQNEKIADLQPVLAYLVFYQWIGAGEQWHRVWLWSSVRGSLGETRVGPPRPEVPQFVTPPETDQHRSG